MTNDEGNPNESLPVLGEAGDEDVFSVEVGRVASASGAVAEEEDAIG